MSMAEKFDYGIANGSQETWPFMTKGNGVSNDHPNGSNSLPGNITVGARTFVYRAPTYVYIPVDGDTLASVAKKLFGANTKHHRDFLRRQGFEHGKMITFDGDSSFANFGDSEQEYNTGNAGQDTIGANDNGR